MNTKIFTIAIALSSFSTHAAWTGSQQPRAMFGSKEIKFGVNNPPSDTCNYFGRHFKFDATIPEGKNMLSIFLSALLSGKEIAIWYTPSTTPGTDQTNGCSEATLAVVSQIGIE